MSSHQRVRFVPLCPSSSDGASCFLLEIGDCRLLLDCGWSEPYDVEDLALLKEVAPSVDVVLLSHADPAHNAALPYAVTHFGLGATLLCTHPVSKMGQMFLYDDTENFTQMSLDEIDAVFSRMVTLKYNQEFLLKDFGLVISAKNCGRTVGGAAWSISKDVYNIVYVVEYSHQRDKQAFDSQVVYMFILNCAMFVVGTRHLNGFQFEAFRKPTLLVTDSKFIQRRETDSEKRNSTLLWTALQTVRSGGHVLIPTDTAGRVLELILLLEEYWLKNKCLRFCNTREEYEKFGEEPKVVLATHASLDTGFARQLAAEWMEDENNIILLTEPPKAGSLARELLEKAESDMTEIIEVEMSKRVPLMGEELEAYEVEKETQRNAHASDEMDHEMDTGEKSEVSSISMTLEETGFEKQDLDTQMADASHSKSHKLTKQLSLEAEGQQSETKHYYFQGVLIDGYQLPEMSIHPVFSFEEASVAEWSVYGEAFDSANLVSALSSQEEQSMLSSAPLLMEEEEKERPSKIVTEHLSLTLSAKVQLFDMSGSTNRHFMQHFISYIQPRNLILVNGSASTHEDFKNISMACCSHLRATGRILCPKGGEKVELEEELCSFEITMDKSMIKNAIWKQTGSTRLAWIQGQLSQPDPSKEEFQLCSMEEATEDTESLYVGDQRLSRIKKALRAKQLETEFVDGGLICNKSVCIRLDPSRSIVMEGPISLDYYLVRKTIDELYKIK